MSKSKKSRKGAEVSPAPQGQPSTLSQAVADYWDEFQAADPKAVHEVRKLTRRAGAEAAVSDPKKKVRREWRDLRRAAAPIRDHDAAGEHLRTALQELAATPAEMERFEQGWAARRAELVARHPLPAAVPAGYDLPENWEARAAAALETDRKELLKQGKRLMKRPDGDSEAWHDWRKLMKRYRYTLELGGKAPKEVRTMLEHLGRLQDAEVLLELLETEQEHFSAEHLKALRSREKTARLQSRASALELWPTLKAHLKGEDTAATSEETAPISAEAKVTEAETAAPVKTATKAAATPAKAAPAKAKAPAKASASQPGVGATAAAKGTAKPAAAKPTTKTATAKTGTAKATAPRATATKASATKTGTSKTSTSKTSSAKAKAPAASAKKAPTAKTNKNTKADSKS